MYALFVLRWLSIIAVILCICRTSVNLSESKLVGHSDSRLPQDLFTPRNLTRPDARGVLRSRQCEWHLESKEWVCDLMLPRISEFLQRMRNTKDHGKAAPENSVWFYTNLQTTGKTLLESLVWPVAWLNMHNIQYYSILDGINMAWLAEQKSFVLGNGSLMEDGAFDAGHPDDNGRQAGLEAYDELVRCYNQATATAAINPDAYIFTTKDSDWSPRSIWAEIELPALTLNKNIQRIWRVNADEAPCGEKQLFWDRQRDSVIEFGRKCLLTDIV